MWTLRSRPAGWGQEFQMAAQRGLEAAGQSFSEANRGFQALAAEMTDYTKRAFDDAIKTWEQLIGVRSVEKALEIQVDLVAKSQATLKVRQEELLGFENPPPNADELDPEYSKGLVKALEIEQDSRDKELAEVDRLRREVKAAFRTEQKLIERNARLAASLPGAQPAAPAETAKAAVSSR